MRSCRPRLIFATAVLLAFPAVAEEAAPKTLGLNISSEALPEGSTGPGATATLALAYDLYTIGRAQGDALLVLSAAKLAASVALTPGGAIKKTTSGPAPATPDVGPAAGPHDAGAMFATALELAAQDALLSGLIRDAEAEQSRGSIGGAKSWQADLSGGRIDLWEMAFKGRAYAELSVIGNGASNLDVSVTDENGNVICFEQSPSDAIYCDFIPSWDGMFYLTVENSGTAANDYYVVSN